MYIAITFLFVIMFLLISGMYAAKQKEQQFAEVIERRTGYVKSIAPDAQIIVNNGIHLFFLDKAQQIFGIDESGKTYSFSGLLSISAYKDGIIFYHREPVSLVVGKDYGHQNTTFPLNADYVKAIAREMLPILRSNMYAELSLAGITPTHEYEHEGTIWGCDLNTRKFYTTYGMTQYYDFSYLRRVTVEDMRNNSLYDGSYIIHVIVKQDDGWGDTDFEISFHEQDETYFNLLSMFKGIRNRQGV